MGKIQQQIPVCYLKKYPRFFYVCWSSRNSKLCSGLKVSIPPTGFLYLKGHYHAIWQLYKKPESVLRISWISKLMIYNHGQKSWDKLTFVALFHTRQTNSSTLVEPLPLPPPLLQCWTGVHAISPEFQHCIGGLEGGKQCILKRITVLF